MFNDELADYFHFNISDILFIYVKNIVLVSVSSHQSLYTHSIFLFLISYFINYLLEGMSFWVSRLQAKIYQRIAYSLYCDSYNTPLVITTQELPLSLFWVTPIIRYYHASMFRLTCRSVAHRFGRDCPVYRIYAIWWICYAI